MTVTLPEVTSDALILVRAAIAGVRRIWRPGYRHSKVGLITVNLVSLDASQRALPGLGCLDREKAAALMGAIDACTVRYGRGTVTVAAAGLSAARKWSTKFDMRSPRYLTCLDELPLVRAE